MDRIYNEEMRECIVYIEKWKRQYSNTMSLIGGQQMFNRVIA